MSAILGMYSPEGRPVDRIHLQRMSEILAHRGPEGEGLWNKGPVGLGHRMLWTTPESLREKLPLANKTGDLILTADARIDNRDELIGQLGLTGLPPEQLGDAQLIMSAYEEWGESCPQKLLGDFAFALWDGRRQILFCTRDHFGMKPFCYCFQPGRIFVFASETKAVLCLPDLAPRLNEIRIADHLASVVDDKAMTFYQEIFRLLPGHSLIVSWQGAKLQPYWSLDPTREIRYNSDQEYGEAFRHIFTEAVRCRLRSAYAVGAELSGGLDSSSIVCVARKLLAEQGGPRLPVFSAIFETVPECDERPFIDAVLAQGGVEPNFLRGDGLSPLSPLDRLHWLHDQPCVIHNQFLDWAWNSAAQQQGIRVMLKGEDGDTTICHGDAYLSELARAGHWDSFAREARGLSQHFRVSTAHWLESYGFPYLNELARKGRWVAFARSAQGISNEFGLLGRSLFLNQGLKPLVPQPLRRVWRLRHGQTSLGGRFTSLIKPGFAKRIGFAERVRARQELETKTVQSLREWHYLGLNGGMVPFVGEWINRNAAAFSMDSRQPFFDKRLVEFCLALPPEQKLSQGWPRGILRRAMENLLPPKVQWRIGKTSLALNFTRSLFAFERGLLKKIIVHDPEVIEEFVDISALREVYHRFVSQPTQADAETLWPAINLALWLRYTGRSYSLRAV